MWVGLFWPSWWRYVGGSLLAFMVEIREWVSSGLHGGDT